MIIYMRNVEGYPLHRCLTRPLPYITYNGTPSMIEVGFIWNGSSTPALFRGVFPRYRHPVASCRHDKRSGDAKNKAERLFADREFARDVGKTSWWITAKIGYIGVRIGAFFGIGNNF